MKTSNPADDPACVKRARATAKQASDDGEPVGAGFMGELLVESGTLPTSFVDREDVRHVNAASQLDEGPKPCSLDLDDSALDVASVRRWTRGALSGVADEEVEDILLIVNELVSNAFDHGDSTRRLRLYRSAEPCFIRVEVDDASPQLPTLGSSRFGGNRGRGMILISRLAKDWGVTHGLRSKTVWAEIICEPQ